MLRYSGLRFSITALWPLPARFNALVVVVDQMRCGMDAAALSPSETHVEAGRLHSKFLRGSRKSRLPGTLGAANREAVIPQYNPAIAIIW